MYNKHTDDTKHAFLIMAHKDDYLFRTLIKMLDHPKNDIFIHMDSKNKKYQEYNIEQMVNYSNTFHCSRTKVTWGGYSMIEAELRLLKEATRRNHYAYYHLLSGQDLPIKTQDYIHSFYERNQGKEFIQFQSPDFTFEERVHYYYPLQEINGRGKSLFARLTNKIILESQKIVKLHRNKGICFQKGANWFDITDDLARYIVLKEPWIRRTFKQTKCCDEVFLQTIVANSKYNDKLFHKEYDDNQLAIMRLIDFERGNPYIFRQEDEGLIKESKCLFARKFSPDVDKAIIDTLGNIYTNV